MRNNALQLTISTQAIAFNFMQQKIGTGINRHERTSSAEKIVPPMMEPNACCRNRACNLRSRYRSSRRRSLKLPPVCAEPDDAQHEDHKHCDINASIIVAPTRTAQRYPRKRESIRGVTLDGIPHRCRSVRIGRRHMPSASGNPVCVAAVTITLIKLAIR